MAWKITVNGVDKTAQIQRAPRVRLGPLNSRATATFECRPGYIPDRFQEVIIFDTDGATPIFGGVVLRRRADGIGRNKTKLITTVECADFSVYADWVLTSLSSDGTATLASILSSLVSTHLAAYGLGLDPGQVAGPTPAAFAWDNVRVSDALREICQRTGFVYTFKPTKLVEAFVPGADAAPFSIVDGGTHCEAISWQDSDKIPANKVHLLCGPSSGAFLYEGRRTANGVATSWQFDVRGSTSPWNVEVGAGSFNYQTVTPAGGGGAFIWDPETYTLSLGTHGTPSNGTVLILFYWVDYPFEVTASSGASPVITARVASPNILSVAPALEAVQEELDRLNQQPRELIIESTDHGWLPGQALTVSIASRLTDSFVITSVDIELYEREHGRYRLEATESAVFQGSYMDQWRQLIGGAGSSVGVSAGTVGGGSVTALGSPVYLGGSRNTAIAQNPAAWAPVVDHVRYTAQGSFTGRIRVVLFSFDAGISATARLWDITAGAAVMTTSAVTSTTEVETSAVGTITSGHIYRLEVLNGTNGKGVYCLGNLESV